MKASVEDQIRMYSQALTGIEPQVPAPTEPGVGARRSVLHRGFALLAVVTALTMAIVASLEDPPAHNIVQAADGGSRGPGGGSTPLGEVTRADPATLFGFTEWGGLGRLAPGQFPGSAAEYRDERATVVIAELRSVRVVRAPGDDPFLEPGAAHVDFEVAAIVGGRWAPFESPDQAPGSGLLTVELPLSVRAEAIDKAAATIDALAGQRYLLFLDLLHSGTTPTPYYRLASIPYAFVAQQPGTGAFEFVVPPPTPLYLEAAQREPEAGEVGSPPDHLPVGGIEAGVTAEHPGRALLAEVLGLTDEELVESFAAPIGLEPLPGPAPEFRAIDL